MLQSKWTAVSNTFVPFEPVPPDKLDEWFVTRPDGPLENLVRQLSPDRVPQQYILSGTASQRQEFGADEVSLRTEDALRSSCRALRHDR